MEQKINEKSVEKLWFPTAFLIALKKKTDHDDSASNDNKKSYHIMETYSNGFRQPRLKKNKKSEEKQWFPMDQFSLKYNIGIKQKMNEEV